jgi:hypothetical protein
LASPAAAADDQRFSVPDTQSSHSLRLFIRHLEQGLHGQPSQSELESRLRVMNSYWQIAFQGKGFHFSHFLIFWISRILSLIYKDIRHKSADSFFYWRKWFLADSFIVDPPAFSRGCLYRSFAGRCALLVNIHHRLFSNGGVNNSQKMPPKPNL